MTMYFSLNKLVLVIEKVLLVLTSTSYTYFNTICWLKKVFSSRGF